VRLLVVAPRLPWPLDKGDRLTVHNLVRHFSRDHDVALVCFLESGQSEDDGRHVSEFAARVDLVPLGRVGAAARTAGGLFTRTPLQVHYYRSRAMRNAVYRVAEEFRPDVLYAHTIRTAGYIAQDTRPTVLAMQISMTLNYRRLARFTRNPVWKALYSVEARRAGTYEPAVARAFDLCLLISETDVAALGRDRPGNVMVNPHGVDHGYFTRSPGADPEPGRIVFTGNMAYPPNVDAAEWFVAEILPLVLTRAPHARLSIVGTDPHRRVRALSRHPAVEVTGRVPDMRPHLEQASVGIDPLRIGAGLQNKVLEGMSMGLPMVITSTANEGIGATPEQEVLVADDPEAFADEVVRVLMDRQVAQDLGARSRDFIVARWSWEAHFADLERALERLRTQPNR
jgi:sugar transferase (PEP-CTERM/EpsH1 system associated)